MWFPQLSLFLATNVFLPAACLSQFDRRQSTFDWYALTPSNDLTWTPCLNGQQCARLNLPLDYSEPSGPKIQVALQKIFATDEANFQGTIIVGAPGGAGTSFISSAGGLLTQIFGPTFDIIALDPRGNGATTPLAQCFDTAQRSDAWALTEVKVLRLGDDSIAKARARDQVVGALCAEKLGGNETEGPDASIEALGVGRFLDTASVAADVRAILEKLGQDKLFYFGASYGTLLGQYFAALYPDKVGRMILDGVIDGENWQQAGDFDSVQDADRVLDAFFDDCVAAGASKCAIWESTADAVGKRAARILSSLRNEPIPVPNATTGPEIVTEDDALAFMIQQFFVPVSGFPVISHVLSALEHRDTTALSQLPFFPSDEGVAPWLQRNQFLSAAACTDFPEMSDSLSDDSEIALIRNLTTLSKLAGLLGTARLRISCGAWPIRAKARYTGPVAAELGVPVLVVSNRYDPATPLASARAVVSRFEGMRLLIQDTVGHTAVLSLSKCVSSAMRVYMTEGKLPPAGTVCQPDVVPLVNS